MAVTDSSATDSSATDAPATGNSETETVGRVGVVGGGTMGSGIVHVLLAAGIDVVLVESDDAALDRADRLVRASLDGAVARGKLAGDVDDVLARLTLTTDRRALAGCDLVVEAVPENLELKQGLLAQIEAVVGDETVLGSNTSSLSLAALGSGLRRPGRLVGLHFFNPVPAQALLEIIRPDATDAATLAAAHRLADRLGKKTVEIRDSPGFATSRLGLALGLEAVRMVEEHVASAEDIDTAMVLGYRHPMGPLRLGDLIGWDVRLGIAEYLASTLGPRFSPPQLLRQMVADGTFGRKSGQGFYTWD